MKSPKISLAITATLIAIFLQLGAGGVQSAPDSLTVTQDESSLERVIKNNLATRHKLIVTEKLWDANDLYLELPFKEDTVPAFRILIDTQKSNYDSASDKITERAVILTVFSNMKVPQERRAAVLEVFNEFNSNNIFSAFYIEDDGEIVCCWAINVMAEGLPTECVYDAVHRVAKNWRDVYPAMSKALK
jgi:hypothetical protein